VRDKIAFPAQNRAKVSESVSLRPHAAR